MPAIPKIVRFDPELLERIDAVRGDVPFAAWVRRACENRLFDAAIEGELAGLPVQRVPNSLGPITVADESFEFSAEDLERHLQRKPGDAVGNPAVLAPIPCQCGGVIYQTGSKKGRCSKCSSPKRV